MIDKDRARHAPTTRMIDASALALVSVRICALLRSQVVSTREATLPGG